MKTATIALLALGLWACNNAASPDTTGVDNAQTIDSGATPGGSSTPADTTTGAAVDPAQLDTLNRNNNR
jgi:hypothetical protein